MAKAALETRGPRRRAARGRPVARGASSARPRDRVPCGVSVGIMDSIPELLDAVGGLSRRGLRPGQAQDRARAGTWRPCARCGSASATSAAPGRRQRGLHPRRRPPPRRARRLRPAADRAAAGRGRPASSTPSWRKPLRTPDLPGRVDRVGRATPPPRSHWARAPSSTSSPAGSAATSRRRRIHDLCRAHGVAVWCGGMLETGLGRAANVALAALPGFTLPGDTSASGRYFAADITAAVRPRRRPPAGAGRARPRCRPRPRDPGRGHHLHRVDPVLLTHTVDRAGLASCPEGSDGAGGAAGLRSRR